MCLHGDNIITFKDAKKLGEGSFGTAILANFIVEPDKCLPLVPPGKNLDEMILANDDNIILTGDAPN